MKELIVGNWKMNLTIKEGLKLASQLSKKIITTKRQAVICPDLASLAFIGPVIKGTNIELGAQDAAPLDQGAATGEVLPDNLRSLGVQYVIVGHSERRQQLGETATLINAKIKTALRHNFQVIVCMGESLADKKAQRTEVYLAAQLRQVLKGITIKKATDLAIAYEPVWAISTSKQAHPSSPEEADSTQAFIKKKARQILGREVRVLYGGSVKVSNAELFLEKKHIDGLLIGATSLEAADFTAIVNGKNKK